MKNKKTIIAIISLACIALVGTTFAYFQTSSLFTNLFNTATYKVVTTEVFESPNNWIPGQEIPKTIVSKNEGSIPAAIRVSYTEQWIQNVGGVETDVTDQIDEGTAIIKFANTHQWIKEGNHYYYKYILNPNQITSSFIESVTLNSDLGSMNCTSNQSGTSQVCETSSAAIGATYKLTITKESIQADKYQSTWNTNVEITERPLIQLPEGRNAYNLQVGDEVCINGATTEYFNFIGYDGNNVKLLSKYNLKVGKIYNSGGTQTGTYSSSDTGYGLQSSDARGYVSGQSRYGIVAFSQTNYWYDGSNLKSKYGSSYPADVYDTDYVTEPDFSGSGFYTTGYSIAYYVEEYKDKLEDYGATISDARLLTYAEATDSSIGCDGSNHSCSTNEFITNTSFWLESASDSSCLWYVRSDNYFNSVLNYFSDRDFGVRPVIIINKNNL